MNLKGVIIISNWSKHPNFREIENKELANQNLKDKGKIFDNSSIKKSLKMITIGLIACILLFFLESIYRNYELEGFLRVCLFIFIFISIILSLLLFYGVYYLILDIIKKIKSR